MLSFHFHAFFKKLHSWFRFNCLVYKGISSRSAVLNPGLENHLGSVSNPLLLGFRPQPNETETRVLESGGPRDALCSCNWQPLAGIFTSVGEINQPHLTGVYFFAYFPFCIHCTYVPTTILSCPSHSDCSCVWFTSTLRKGPCKSSPS